MRLEDKEAFDRHFASVIERPTERVLDGDSVATFKSLARLACAGFIESRAHLLPRRTLCDVIDADDFNAYASSDGAVDLIGITVGACYLLAQKARLAAALTAQGAWEPSPGFRAQIERVNWSSVSSVQSLANDGWLEELGEASVDGATVVRLFDSAVRCLLSHELGHIYHGHTYYLKSSLGSATLDERGGSDLMPQDWWHICELEADEMMAWYVAEPLLPYHRIGADGRPELFFDKAMSPDDQSNFEEAGRRLGVCWIILEQLAQCSPDGVASVSDRHPSAFVRAQYVMLWLTGQAFYGGALWFSGEGLKRLQEFGLTSHAWHLLSEPEVEWAHQEIARLWETRPAGFESAMNTHRKWKSRR